jgi:hypothetical protein
VRNAFSEIPEMGAMKFPAAPALAFSMLKQEGGNAGRTADDKVDLAEFLDRALRRGLELRRDPHVGLDRDALLACLLRELLRGSLQTV